MHSRTTVTKAREKAEQLAPTLARIMAGDARSITLELLGSAAILSMADSAALVRASERADGIVEILIRVTQRRRGRPKAAPATPALAVPTGPGSWSLQPEDRGVFAYGVRRVLAQQGWSCSPWDDCGNGTPRKEWRSLVDSRRPTNSSTPTRLRPSTIHTWDTRAQRPGYTEALCAVAVRFVESDASSATRPEKTFYLHKSVAEACRKLSPEFLLARAADSPEGPEGPGVRQVVAAEGTGPATIAAGIMIDASDELFSSSDDSSVVPATVDAFSFRVDTSSPQSDDDSIVGSDWLHWVPSSEASSTTSGSGSNASGGSSSSSPAPEEDPFLLLPLQATSDAAFDSPTSSEEGEQSGAPLFDAGIALTAASAWETVEVSAAQSSAAAGLAADILSRADGHSSFNAAAATASTSESAPVPTCTTTRTSGDSGGAFNDPIAYVSNLSMYVGRDDDSYQQNDLAAIAAGEMQPTKRQACLGSSSASNGYIDDNWTSSAPGGSGRVFTTQPPATAQPQPQPQPQPQYGQTPFERPNVKMKSAGGRAQCATAFLGSVAMFTVSSLLNASSDERRQAAAAARAAAATAASESVFSGIGHPAVGDNSSSIIPTNSSSGGGGGGTSSCVCCDPDCQDFFQALFRTAFMVAFIVCMGLVWCFAARKQQHRGRGQGQFAGGSGSGGFSSTLVGCHSDLGSCCVTFYCPAWQWGRIAAAGASMPLVQLQQSPHGRLDIDQPQMHGAQLVGIYACIYACTCFFLTMPTFSYPGSTCAMPFCLGCYSRPRLRRRLQIPGTCLQDCMIHSFWHWCALCQESREIDLRMRDAWRGGGGDAGGVVEPLRPVSSLSATLVP